MITYVQGDLFTSPATVLVNTVNTVGVMGKGIAREFKRYFPEMFERYQELCEREELTIGRLYLYRAHHKSVLNFPTKRHWRQRSRLKDIEAGLETFVATYADYGITSIAFPQLGCGNGELDWESQVRPLMERYLGHLPIDVYIHAYDKGANTPEHCDSKWMKQWLRSEPQSLPFSEVWEDLLRQLTDTDQDWYKIGDWSVVVLADIKDQPTTVLFRNGQTGIALNRDELLDIWQRLRAFGFMAANDLPVRFSRIVKPLFELLMRLDYIEPARFSSRMEATDLATDDLLSSREAEGIRIMPPLGATAASSQSLLFDLSGVA